MPRNPTPASVPKDLLAVVAERYGMHAPLSARRLTGGYANDVFLLEGLACAGRICDGTSRLMTMI
jgi:hypothetical protein